MRRITVFRNRVPESAKLTPEPGGTWLATSLDNVAARGDTPEEAADLLTATITTEK